jgi:hypothetical protein
VVDYFNCCLLLTLHYIIKRKIISIFKTRMTSSFTIDRRIIRKGKIKEQGNDFLFWQSQPFWVRLTVIEELRREYNTWKYGPEQRFQRVYRIVKRK